MATAPVWYDPDPPRYSTALMGVGIGVSALSLGAAVGGGYLFTLPSCQDVRPPSDTPPREQPACRDDDTLAAALLALAVGLGGGGIAMTVVGATRVRAAPAAARAACSPTLAISRNAGSLRWTF